VIAWHRNHDAARSGIRAAGTHGPVRGEGLIRPVFVIHALHATQKHRIQDQLTMTMEFGME
jgi:hypothetical protein